MEMPKETFYAIKLANGKYLDMDGYGFYQNTFSHLIKGGLYQDVETANHDLKYAKAELEQADEKKINIKGARVVPLELCEK